MSASASQGPTVVRWRVRALGPVTVTGPGQDGERAAAGLGRYPARLLAALVAVGPDGAARERLIHMVWGVSMDTRTLGRLRTTLSRLRSVLATTVGAGDVIVDVPPSRLRLNDNRVDVDAWTLLETAGAPGRDLDAILGLLSQVRGPFAAGHGRTPWLETYRICCREAFDALAEHAVGALAARGRNGDAERLALRARTADLLDDRRVPRGQSAR
jgi:DNA-binding SARP family transcriptional activator